MEERAGDSRRDGNEVALSRKDFDLAGAGELQQINRPPTADVSSRHFVNGDGRKCWKQLAGMDEEFMQRFKCPYGTRVLSRRRTRHRDWRATFDRPSGTLGASTK